MKETGILFSGGLIPAIQDGSKTQTRRVLRTQPLGTPSSVEVRGTIGRWHAIYSGWEVACGKYHEWKCPYGKVGDRLWVRETWDFRPMSGECAKHRIAIIGYKADGATKAVEVPREANPTVHSKWRSPRFMPKWAARIWLEITGISVERVQDISEEDAIAEGVHRKHLDDLGQTWKTYRRGFESLWDSLNAKRGYPWSEEELPEGMKTGNGRMLYGNPWVWKIEFKKLLTL